MMVLDTALNIFALVAGGVVLELFASGWARLHQQDSREALADGAPRLELPELSPLENPS